MGENYGDLDCGVWSCLVFGDDIDGRHDPRVTMVRVNPESTSAVEPRTPVEVAVDEVLF